MEKILEFKNVYKKFDNKIILENINFSIDEFDIFGFLGPNGAGKTTCIRLILDLLKSTEGDILIFGKKNNINNIRKNIGFCLDNDGLYENMTAYENLEFFDRIYNPKENRSKRIFELLEKVELTNEKNKMVKDFSKGMKKRLGIARALISNPKFLILDEPLSGLDPSGQRLFKNLFKEISKTATIFFSSHNLNDVEDICNKVAIINKKILLNDNIKNMKSSFEQTLIIKVNEKDVEKIKDIIQDINHVNKICCIKDEIKIYYNKNIEFNYILSKILEKNIKILDIKHVNLSLENIYFNVIGE